MKRLFISLLTVILATWFAGRVFAMIVVQPVTKDTQAKDGLDFSLSAVPESGTVWVQLEVPRKGKLATLSLVQIEVKDKHGKEILLAPVATSDEKGTTKAQFRLASEQAARCNIILVTEASTPPAPAFAVNYSVSLKGYIDKGK